MRSQHTLHLGVAAVRKEPETQADAERLERERRWLTLAAHPGVVRLLPGNGPAIWTRDVGERSLGDLGTLDPQVACGLGAAAATILADLHDLGIVHGAPGADHLLVDTEGRPVLCSFGRASPATPATARDDVRILARTLFEAVGPGAPRRLDRLLTRAAGPSRAPTARQLARELTRAHPRPLLAPSAGPGPDPSSAAAARTPTPRPCPDLLCTGTLPPESGDVPASEVLAADPPGPQHIPDPRLGPDTPSGRPAIHRRFVLTLIALIATATAAAVGYGAGRPGADRPRAGTSRSAGISSPGTTTSLPAGTDPTATSNNRPADALATSAAGAPGSRAGTGGTTTPPGTAPRVHVGPGVCAPVDAGCRPIPIHEGLFVAEGKRWRLSERYDLVAVGRWTCAGPLPAALDPRTGQLWVFPAWTTPTAKAVAIVPGATSLSAAPHGSGCDLIAVTRHHASTLFVDPLPELTGRG